MSDGVYITEVNHNGDDKRVEGFNDIDHDLIDDSDEEEKTKQIFNVREAVPPTDYEAPYSQLPSSVVLKRVKEKVKNSYT